MRRFVSYLVLVPSSSSFAFAQVTELSIPPEWLHTYGHIFPCPTFHHGIHEKTINVTRAQPVRITEVIVTALSCDAYDVASSNGSPLETWLSDDSLILRQGEVHTFSSDMLPTNGHGSSGLRRCYRFRLDMVGPVLQGYAQKGLTRFYVALAGTSKEPSSGDEKGLESGSDPEVIEIDESFLASSVLHPSQNPPHSSPHETVPNGLPRTNDKPEGLLQSHTDSRLRAEPLPYPASKAQDNRTLYIRTSDLGRVGVLNGDWVRFLLHPCLQEDNSDSRPLPAQVRHRIIDSFRLGLVMI
jgi:peroxin-6